MEILRLKPDEARRYFNEIAELHAQEIHHGVLSLMGKSFLSCLYRSLSKAPQTGVWIALEKNKVVGFIAGSGDIKNSYMSVIIKDTFPLIFFAGKTLFSTAVFKKIPSLFIYPFKKQHKKLAKSDKGFLKAELLAIAVDTCAKRKGVGRLLIETFEKQLRVWKISGYYRVTTNLAEKDSNAFYSATGFEKFGTMPHHQMILQIYIKNLE